VVASYEDADLLWRWMQARRGQVLGLDCETNAVVAYSPEFRLRTEQISDGREMWVIQAERPGMLDVVREVTRTHPYWVGHYPGDAEIKFLHNACPGAVRIDQVEPHIVDTQTVMACYDPRTVTTFAKKDRIHPGIPLRKNLKQSVARYLNDSRLVDIEYDLHRVFREIVPLNDKGKPTLRKLKEEIIPYGFANIDVNDPTYLSYAGFDALFTLRLWHVMVEVIKKRGQWPLVKSDLRWQWHADIMTAVRGLPVDGPYVKWLDGELAKVIDDNRLMLDWHGIPETCAGNCIKDAFNRLGMKSPKKTRGGGESWDKHVINDLLQQAKDANKLDHPVAMLASAIQIVRRARRFRINYVKPMLECLKYDGRVHCGLRVAGTLTGRNAAYGIDEVGMPVQQLPKHDTRVRAGFRAPPGWVFVTSDFRQGEPRVMAANSDDDNLKRDILSGDFNSALALRAFGPKYDKAYGKKPGTPHFEMRQNAKAAFLAKSYAAMITKFAETLGVPLEEGKAIYEKLTRDYSQLTAYTRKLNRQPYIVLDSGRIVPLWDKYYVDVKGVHCDHSKYSRLGLNYSTQGNQRDLLGRAVHILIQQGWGWAIVMYMHDEIVGMVPAEQAMDFAKALKAAMTMTYHGFPIECETDGIDTEPYGVFRETWMPQPPEFDLRDLSMMDDEEEEDEYVAA
jgi:DNA polymerase-1